jgi:hypothetical protein
MFRQLRFDSRRRVAEQYENKSRKIGIKEKHLLAVDQKPEI